MPQHIFSLYRSYLRQIRALPHIYLRHFFRLKSADDFRSILQTKSGELRRKHLKRVSSDLRRLQAANSGHCAAFDRVLDIAYGRTGKLRWELMQPLLSDPNASSLPSYSRKHSTCSPAYSSELVALLTSGISRTTKPLQKHLLTSPPGLPGRAKSDSEDAVLLGPLSSRREHNIRRRFFKNEWKKVYPPLHVSMQHPTSPASTRVSSGSPPNFGFQDTAILHELLALAGSPSVSPDPPSKPRRSQIQNAIEINPFDGTLPRRWLRRRYQALLGRVPLLTSRPSQSNSKHPYDVQLADNAITASTRPHPPRLRSVDVDDVPWISDVLMIQSGERRT